MSEQNKYFMDIPSSEGVDTYRVMWDDKVRKVTCSCKHYVYRLSMGEGKCKHILQAETLGFKPPEDPIKFEDGRIPRAQIEPLAQKALKLVAVFADKAEICGSYRRNKPTLKDLDIVVGLKELDPSRIKAIKDRVKEASSLVVLDGESRFTVMMEGVQIDYRFVLLSQWVYMLMHTTGSASENIRMRQIAQAKQYSLNEYGLWKKKSKETEKLADLLNPVCEQEVYDFLHVPYKRPEER